MQLGFEYLVDRPDDVPRVIDWWYSVWADRMGLDIDKTTARFMASLNKLQLPIDILAIYNGNAIGTAALKKHEMREIYPQYEYWLGSVFVDPDFRGEKVATALANHVIGMARQRQLPQLYLQTADLSGGLYSSLGWEPLDRLVYKNTDTLLMVNRLQPG